MDTLGAIEVLVRVLWIAGAACFVLGLVRMNSPATARNGNLLSAGGMAVAIGATGKLQGLIRGKPILVAGGQLVTGALALVTVVAAVYLFATGTPNIAVMLVILAAALIFGVTMTLPIGGADMPVVISLLNSFT